MFLFFWIFMWCYGSLYFSTCVWARDKGLRFETDQYLSFAEAFSVTDGEIEVHPAIRRCIEKLEEANRYPDLICLDFCTYSEIYSSGKPITADQLSNVLQQFPRTSSVIEVVVHPSFDSEYGEFVSLLDDLYRFQLRRNSPPIRLLIVPPGSNPSAQCRDSGTLSVSYYEELSEQFSSVPSGCLTYRDGRTGGENDLGE